MKKNTIIFITPLTILSFLLISYTNWNNTKVDASKSSDSKISTFESQNEKNSNSTVIPDLFYGVDTRFAAIKKEDIHKATTIYDFLTEEEVQQIAHINSVEIIIIKDNQQSELREYSESEKLSEAQIQLLKSTQYFSHFTIKTEFKGKNTETGKLEARFFGPHITVVPDKQAIYIDGKEALLNYFKDASKYAMNVIKGDKIGAIKLSFTVTKKGIISNVTHDAMTTGYISIDEKFIELIKNIPGKWTPAENSKGEKIDQELVFTFGPANGC